MATLAKAFLVELLGDSAQSTPNPKRKPIPVQFNPTSLHLQMTNSDEGGKSRQRQAEQHVGAATTTLSLDLVFDSADEGSAVMPSDVRLKVKEVETFVLPSPGSTDPPPRVRFQWGTFLYEGVMASLNEDIDLFSVEGVPLRAKVSIQIKGQDPKFAALQTEQGRNRTMGQSPQQAGPGSPGGGPTNRTGTALAGESAADFAARMGLDPAAWRGLAAGLEGTLSLQAGLQIDFNASLSASAGVGVSSGTQSGASASIAGSLGLDASAVSDLGPVAAAATAPAPSGIGTGPAGGVGAGATPGVVSTGGSGFALSAAGGLAAAVQTAKAAATQAVAASERSAFGLPPSPPAAAATAATTPAASGVPMAGAVAPAPPPPPGGLLRGCTPLVAISPTMLPDRSHPPLRLSGALVAGAPAPAGAPPPAADPRATSFGLGIPLKPAITGAADDRRAMVGGGGVVGPRPLTPVSFSGGAGTSPWRTLPAAEPGRAAAEQAQRAMSLRRQQAL